MSLAFTRAVSPRLAEGELTHRPREAVDVDLARAQHGAYEAALAAAGLTVIRLPPLPDFPDGVFVEDTAVILGGHAVITRPGAPSRRGETVSTAEGVAAHLEAHALADGRLDGGDVMLVGRTLYVGLAPGGRTDAAGIAALAAVAGPLGYKTAPIALAGCLHLKTAATFADRAADGDPWIIVNPAHVDPAAFAADARTLNVSPPEADAANAVRAKDTLLIAAGHPRLAEALAERGFALAELDTSEFRKCEAALSCLSLVVEWDEGERTGRGRPSPRRARLASYRS